MEKIVKESVTCNGRITVPETIRDVLGISKDGTEVLFIIDKKDISKAEFKIK